MVTKPADKPGWQTTEFWLAVLLMLCSTYLMATDHLQESTWALANGINTAGYALSRGVAKIKS